VSLRDTLLQLGYVLIAGGAVFATWALLTGPLARFVRPERGANADVRPEPEDDPGSGSSEEPS
jgi:hypothetical protein